MNTSNTNGYTNVPITFLRIYKYGCLSLCCNQILATKFDTVFQSLPSKSVINHF